MRKHKVTNKQAVIGLIMICALSFVSNAFAEIHKDSPTGPVVTKGEGIKLQMKDPEVKLYDVKQVQLNLDTMTLKKKQ